MGLKKIFALDLSRDAIGVVRLDGMISMEKRGFLFGESTVDRVKKNLEKMAKKNQVKAIILRINSPGGTVASCQEIVTQIRKVRQQHKKPIIALLGDVAASGGYYVASATDLIVADSGTITGSIGVIFQTGQFEGLLRRLGVSFVTIKTGKFKDIGNPVRTMTLEEKELLQGLANTALSQFITDVAKGRNMPLEDVKKIADGRVFIAEEALKLNMIDATGGFEEAVSLAKKLTGIKGEPRIVWDGELKEELLEEIFRVKTKTFFDLPWDRVPTGLLYLWPGF